MLFQFMPFKKIKGVGNEKLNFSVFTNFFWHFYHFAKLNLATFVSIEALK